MTEGMVVILTALNLEYDAVREKLENPRVHRHNKGTRFEIGTIRGTKCRVALGLTDKGNHRAGVLAERAIQEFSPVAVLFVGVAGALWDTPLGDVVVATHVYAYHGGTSEDDGMKARPRVWEMTHEVHQIATHVGRAREWATGLSAGARLPEAHFGAIAAGEIVQNSRVSGEARWLRDHYNDALAVEMEAAGVAQAGHLNGAAVAIVRGISDRADGSKSTDEDRTWQPKAARNAASFAIRLAAELINDRGQVAMHEDGNARRFGSVSNVSSGQVGIQAGYVSGSTVHMSASSPGLTRRDVAAELVAFRDQLRRERANGTVDDDTYVAAEAELDIADKTLGVATDEGKSTFMLALKRLRGLVADVAELAARIATVMAAVKGLS